MNPALQSLLDEVLKPLIEADAGQIEIVSASETEIVIALGGACAGCPGAVYTTQDVITPLLREALGPSIKVSFIRSSTPSGTRIPL